MMSASSSSDPAAPDAGICPADILAFWRDAGPSRWFTRDGEFDATVRTRFLAVHDAAAAGLLAAWEDTADGAMALLIVLDQFPRNMFRGSARAYASDALARAVAGRALARGFDLRFANPERRFFYLPFMHSEDLADQERCLSLCAAAADREGVDYAVIHADIIRRFGRFPHRNEALGRTTTAEEAAFLAAGGFAGERFLPASPSPRLRGEGRGEGADRNGGKCPSGVVYHIMIQRFDHCITS
jgi:uncharacterized protein (DUF924 family)